MSGCRKGCKETARIDKDIKMSNKKTLRGGCGMAQFLLSEGLFLENKAHYLDAATGISGFRINKIIAIAAHMIKAHPPMMPVGAGPTKGSATVPSV